jgi:hypothetical protein
MRGSGLVFLLDNRGPKRFSSVCFFGVPSASVALGVVGVHTALVPEAFVALRELIFVDILEELFGVVGKPLS